MISIVTPVFNSEKFISQTIESVQNQTYKNWELFLIDDCSTDNSTSILNYYADRDNRITVLSNKNNSGPSISRNRGIEAARGRYLAFLDSDDIWLPEFLEVSLKEAIEHGHKFTFTSYKRFDEELCPLLNDFVVPGKVSHQNILKTCPILLSSTFIDIGFLGKIYMPIMDKRQDWGFFLAILKNVKFAYGIHKPLVIYRIRKDSISRNKYKLIPYVWKIYREVEKFNVIKSSYYFTHWAINGFKKYYFNS